MERIDHILGSIGSWFQCFGCRKEECQITLRKVEYLFANNHFEYYSLLCLTVFQELCIQECLLYGLVATSIRQTCQLLDLLTLVVLYNLSICFLVSSLYKWSTTCAIRWSRIQCMISGFWLCFLKSSCYYAGDGIDLLVDRISLSSICSFNWPNNIPIWLWNSAIWSSLFLVWFLRLVWGCFQWLHWYSIFWERTSHFSFSSVLNISNYK